MYTNNNDIPYSKQMFQDSFNGQTWNKDLSETRKTGYYHIFSQYGKEYATFAKINSDSSLPANKTIYTTTNIRELCKGIVLVEVKYH